jgi:hypothetical protein
MRINQRSLEAPIDPAVTGTRYFLPASRHHTNCAPSLFLAQFILLLIGAVKITTCVNFFLLLKCRGLLLFYVFYWLSALAKT